MIETKKIIEAAERHLEGSDMFVVECTSTMKGQQLSDAPQHGLYIKNGRKVLK